MGSSFCAVNGGSSWCTYYRIIFPSPFFTAHCALRTNGNDRYSQRCNCRGDCHRSRDSRRMVLTTVARDDASNEKSGARAGYWRIYSRYSGVIGGPVSLFKGLDEMQQMVANQAFSTSDYFLLAVIKLAAGRYCRQWLSRWANLPGSVCRRGIRVDAA